MTRIRLVPVVGVVLAIASSGGFLLLQERVAKGHDARLTLVRTENRLNELQGLPWQVQNPKFGSPERIRTMMGSTGRSIVATIDRLRQSAPAARKILPVASQNMNPCSVAMSICSSAAASEPPLIVSAAAGWEFADLAGRHHAGGGSHGSLLAGDSEVPMLAVGLETLPGSIVEVMPAVLEHFGVGLPAYARAPARG